MTTPSKPDDAFIHPELRQGVRYMPQPAQKAGPDRRSVTLARLLVRLGAAGARPLPGVSIENTQFSGPAGAPAVRVRLYRPQGQPPAASALLWFHGGGYYMGALRMDDRRCSEFALEAGVLVASVDYRLAPEHPFPAALEDGYATLVGLAARAAELGVDPTRIAIGGASAGGGLAAALAQLAHDRGNTRPAFQLLVYPMLDDRTGMSADPDDARRRVWGASDNRFGWTSYLGRDADRANPPAYASAARRADLSGLPPAWIGVGALDLFHEEDLAYADRLRACGVACETVVVPGAYHGFDVVAPKAGVVIGFKRDQFAALRHACIGAATSATPHKNS
jgi:acetyl esterase/lipase